MNEANYDRKMTEEALMKSLRRAKLALRKGQKFCVKLEDKRLREMNDWLTKAEQSIALKLKDIEECVGWELSPPPKVGEMTGDED